jgi:hypothetical protein
MNAEIITDSTFVPRFFWEGIALLECYWIQQRPYFTSRAIGIFLGYASPVHAIEQLARKNPKIEDEKWSRRVNRQDAGTNGTQTLRVFDPIGLLALCALSDSPRARFCSISAARLAVAFQCRDLEKRAPLKHKQQLALAALQDMENKPYRREKAKRMVDIAQSLGKSFVTMKRWRREFINRGILTAGLPAAHYELILESHGAAGKHKEHKRGLSSVVDRERTEILKAFHSGLTIKDTAETLNVPLSKVQMCWKKFTRSGRALLERKLRERAPLSE